MTGHRVAIVGATGLVGRTVQSVLEESRFPLTELILLASERSAGTRLTFAGDALEVKLLEERHLDHCDVVFFTAGAEVSRQYAPLAATSAGLVVDNSSAFRLDPEVPLVIPEVNGSVLQQLGSKGFPMGIVANPNCSTMQMVMALHPLHLAYGLEMVVVSTYQSVSGSGAKGIRALEYEIETGVHSPDSPYPHSVAFNVLPQVDVFDPQGWSGEEQKMILETRKIMDLPRLHIVPTAVRVPVRIGHSESIYARFERSVNVEAAKRILAQSAGVVVWDEPGNSQYPLARLSEGCDEVFVGRIRSDPMDDRALTVWVVADNLRKGAATNAVQIAAMALSYEPGARSSKPGLGRRDVV